MSNEDEDWAQMALRSSQLQFTAECPFPFLVGTATLVKPHRPQPTQFIQLDHTATGGAVIVKQIGGTLVPLLFPIRKVQAIFPSMITVGRTANNDVVIPDVQMSRFHAFFRLDGNNVEVGDAGSRNGTWVGQEMLVPKGPVVLLKFGEFVRFARLEAGEEEHGKIDVAALQGGLQEQFQFFHLLSLGFAGLITLLFGHLLVGILNDLIP